MIVFRSEVGPDVMMFDDIARRMMDLMGKETSVRGVVTVEQMPEAIARLKAAMAADKALGRRNVADEEDVAEVVHVGLAQRALPLIELLELSLARKAPVTWGI